METDFPTLQSSLTSALVSTTRTTNTLANSDLPFHRSLDAFLASKLDRQNARLLNLATNLLDSAAGGTSEAVRPPPSLKDVEGIENNWRAVVDVVDSLLERADIALDEFTGAVRRLSPAADVQAITKPLKTSKIATQLRAQDMEKPQLLFDHVPTNRDTEPFKPLLLTKPHAVVPLETEPVATDEDSQAQYPHPYQLEIEQYRYPSSVYTQAEPIPYHPFDSTTATFVDTEEELASMLSELRQAKEIAIDLEHHDQRSYIGIVSLMQISTRDRDWIIDTLKPWRRKLQILNGVFANPNIIKVLHGAYMDIVWLQRDLGLYIVGLFDTHYAARALGYQGGSLAFLLKKFANVDAQKQYQTADWRVRPLPQELFDYARSDTHYLLYIYDSMRNELIQRSDFSLPDYEGDKLMHVLEQSSETALQRYEYPVYDSQLGLGEKGWYKMLSRTPALFTKEQFAVFRAVHQWRDDVAREQDDSVHYVMPNHQIFSIARELPTNRAALLGIAQPTTQTVRLRADELLAVIIKAKEKGKDGPEMWEVLNKVEPVRGFANRRDGDEVQKMTLDYGDGDKSQPVHPSAPVKATTASPSVNGEGAPPLRSTTSTFWGGAFDNAHKSQHQTRGSSSIALDLRVPMPVLTAEVFADPSEVAVTPVQSSQPVVEPTTTPAETAEDDEVFVLKEMGKKRKRDHLSVELDGVATQSDEVALSTEDVEKAERKRARREAKRAARAAAAGNEDESINGGLAAEEEPFDYASAPSILNPPRPSREEMRERKKKEVNPYAKKLELDAEGLGRTFVPKGGGTRERMGRSMTYR